MPQIEVSQMKPLNRAVMAIGWRFRAVEDLKAKLAGIPRRHWLQRLRLRQNIASLGREIKGYNSEISREDVLELADEIRHRVWGDAARGIIPKKNPYGPAARERFDEIRDQAVELARDYIVFKDEASCPLTGLPEVEALVSRDSIESEARRTIEKLAEIADSPEIIHESGENDEGIRWLRIQHVASGLRAEFMIGKDDIGWVASRSSKIPFLDPAKTGTLPEGWERVAGLGIGRRIYEKAHQLEPDVRWGPDKVSDYAQALRKKLHSDDPYVWYASCRWCDEHLLKQRGRHWGNAVESDFDGHP